MRFSKNSLASVVVLSLLVLVTVTSAGIVNEKSDEIFKNIQGRNTNPFEQPDLVGIYNGILYAENNRDTKLIVENVIIGDFNCGSNLEDVGTLSVSAINVSECVSRSGILRSTIDGVFRDVTLTTRDFIVTKNIYVGITGEHGICGSSKDTCQSGIFASKTDTETHYKWSCVGVGEGDSKQCQEEKPCATQISYFCEGDIKKYRFGNCSTTSGTRCDYGCSGQDCNTPPPQCRDTTNWCSGGATPYHIPDTQTHHIWGCEDSNGQVTCRKIKTGSLSITGQCDNKIKHGCVGGTLNLNAYTDNQTHHRWRCDGQNGGGNSQMCSKAITCSAGWICDGNYRKYRYSSCALSSGTLCTYRCKSGSCIPSTSTGGGCPSYNTCTEGRECGPDKVCYRGCCVAGGWRTRSCSCNNYGSCSTSSGWGTHTCTDTIGGPYCYPGGDCSHLPKPPAPDCSYLIGTTKRCCGGQKTTCPTFFNRNSDGAYCHASAFSCCDGDCDKPYTQGTCRNLDSRKSYGSCSAYCTPKKSGGTWSVSSNTCSSTPLPR